MPARTEEQLSRMIRFRDRKKIPVSHRLDPQGLERLKFKGEGHLTLINDILTNLMEAEQASARRQDPRARSVIGLDSTLMKTSQLRQTGGIAC
ncbi:MAG TPA: hypothetical protein VGD59_02470 [Acidisarcina sp.]